MKFCRFLLLDSSVSASASPLYGLLEGEEIREISGVPGASGHAPRAVASREYSPSRAVDPSKVVCVGRNTPLTPPNLATQSPKSRSLSLSHRLPLSARMSRSYSLPIPGASIRRRARVVVGRRCAQLGDTDDPFPYLFGYTCLNDDCARPSEE